ncbi:MAG: tetratricopeptide repeat protein [Deltaproteobacteria bacterium]|nr:tetratricopeptide repeat protein [Deltaproteobacteria bacterium]
MLKVDYTINHIPVGPEYVASLYESISQPLMNFPETGAHPTGAYLLGIRHPNNVYTLFLYLFQPGTGAVVVYVSEPRALSREQFQVEEHEALGFVESMGFLLNSMDFGRMSPADRLAVIERVPLFHPPRTTLDLVDVASSTQSLPANDALSQPAQPTKLIAGVPEAERVEGLGGPLGLGGGLDSFEGLEGLEGLVLAGDQARPQPAKSPDASRTLERIGKLLGTFGVALTVFGVGAGGLGGCATSSPAERGSKTESHLSLGNQQLSQGQWAEAVRSFTTVLEENDTDREALWGMGLAYWRLERPTEAEAYFRRAIASDPKWSTPKNELACVLVERGRCDEAEALLRQVLDDIFYPFPEFAEHNLARALACEGRTDEALKSLEALVLKRPHFCRGYLTMAQLSVQAKQPELTIRACDGFEENCEKNEEIRKQILPEQSAMCYFRKGLAHAEMGDVESARTSFMRCQSDGTFGSECIRSLQMLPPLR